MANQEHIIYLRRDIQDWNSWRQNNKTVHPDLSLANLIGVNFTRADLSFANFNKANLNKANLNGANLSFANLSGADLSLANLSSADFTCANLIGANLSFANLTNADFSFANLSFANLSFANLSFANFDEAKIGWTTFGDQDLRVVKGLETIQHKGPSLFGINTFYLSQGNIPVTFIQGTGVPNMFLDMIRVIDNNFIEYCNCIISYSSQDQVFAGQLHADLQKHNIRCWLVPCDAEVNDEFLIRIDKTIHSQDKLLLILSQHSIESIWMKKEVETAFEKERQQGKLVLIPVKLDDTLMQIEKTWISDIRRMRYIGDFQRWKEHEEYKKAFISLLTELKVNRTD